MLQSDRRGLCDALRRSFDDAETLGDIRLALVDADVGGLSGANYFIATRFVAFLLETRGVDQLRALCELGAHDPQQFEQDVLQTYGVSFDDLATEFDTYPEWYLQDLRQDQACESSDILVQPTEWDFHFACGEPGVEGKIGRAFDMQRLVELRWPRALRRAQGHGLLWRVGPQCAV